MGNRANIKIDQGAGDVVFLYTHWRGDDIDTMARDGLRKAEMAGRLDDGQYCSRIVAEHFFRTHSDDGEPATGAGLSGAPHDGDVALTIDMLAQVVHYQGRTIPLTEFIAEA